MKFDLTKKEYRLLLDMVEIARWVLHSHQKRIPDEKKPYNALEQYIASYAKSMDMEDLMLYDDQLEGYFPTGDYHEQYMAHVEEFENEVFWDELINRLACRDLLKTYGEEHVRNLDSAERINKLAELEEFYRREFEQYGLLNLILTYSQDESIWDS